MLTVKIGSTNVIDLEKFWDRIDKEYQEGATVEASFFDPSGTAITDAQDLVMEQVAGTEGAATVYRAELPHTVTASVAEGVGTVLVVGTNVAGKVRRFLESVTYEN
jgi:hypothetical protein